MSQQGFMVALKRVYDEPEPGDDTRVLVERLWPRGLSKERAHVDAWLKEITPAASCAPGKGMIRTNSRSFAAGSRSS